MNVLFMRFPDTVQVCGKAYRIETDFREWIKLSELLERTEHFTPRICSMILEWYIDVPPMDNEAAIYALQEFLAADGIHPEIYSDEGEEDECQEDSTTPKQLFSFSQDAVCIYSDFFSVYGIDIETVSYMHWWKFLVLFEGLPANTEIKERIYYRGVDLNEIKDKSERERIKKIKKKIALKRPQRKMSDYQIGDVFA